MKWWKRIGAIVIAFVLGVTGLQLDGIISAANENADNHVKVKSVTTGSQGDESYIYLHVSNPATVPGTGVNYYGGLNIEMKGVDYDKTLDLLSLEAGGPLRLTFYTAALTVSDKAEITLKKGTYTSVWQTQYSISFAEDYTIVYDATTGTWSEKTKMVSEMTITGLIDATCDYFGEATKHWRIRLNTSVAVPSGHYDGLKAEINGNPYEGTCTVLGDGGQLYVVLWGYHDSSPSDGDTITFKQGDGIGTSSDIRIIQDFIICYNAMTASWEANLILTDLVEGTTICEPIQSAEEGFQLFSFESINEATSYNASYGGWFFYLNPSDNLPGDNDSGANPATFSSLQMSVDGGEKFSVRIDNSSHENTGFIAIPASVLPQDISQDTYVVLHAGIATSNTECKGIALKQDFVMKFDAEEKWSVVEYDGTKWEIHLEALGLFETKEAELFLWPVQINGKDTNVTVSKKKEDFVVNLLSSQVPTNGTNEVELKLLAGTVLGNQGSSITLAKGINLYFNQYGLSKDNPIAPDTADIGLTLLSFGTNKNALYMHALKKDVLPTDNTWGIRPRIVSGFCEGTYYLESTHGVYVDDIRYKPNESSVEFIKHDQMDNPNNVIPAPADMYSEYYLGLSGISVGNGTKVTLKGVFQWEGRLIEFTPVNFIWNEEMQKWTVEVDTTYVAGDANGDDIADVRDIVRVQRYLFGEEDYEIPVNLTDADMIKEEAEGYKVNETDLTEMKLSLIDALEMELFAFCGPRSAGYRSYKDGYGDSATHPNDPEGGWEGWINEESFQDYKNCGFTYLFPERDAFYPSDGTAFEESNLYSYMNLAEKMNIPVVVMSNSLLGMASSGQTELTQQNMEHLHQMTAELKKYDVFKGYGLWDEPSISMAPSVKATRDYLLNKWPGMLVSSTCLPIYSSITSFTSLPNPSNKVVAYEEYMDAMSNALGTFTYDHYPLWNDTRYGNYVDETWFQNLYLVAKHAKENQYYAGVTVQSSSYGTALNYKWETVPYHHRKVETKADVSFQVYTALAYGMKSISYYTYWSHWNEAEREVKPSAMVNYPTDEDGNPINGAAGVKTDAYYAVKAVNQEIKKFDHEYLKFDWEGTLALVPQGTTASDAFRAATTDYQSPRIASASATQETLVGCMTDASGRDGFMIVNATEPSKGLTSNVTIQFHDASKVKAYINGAETEIILQGGKYTLPLEAGEGVFLIPII